LSFLGSWITALEAYFAMAGKVLIGLESKCQRKLHRYVSVFRLGLYLHMYVNLIFGLKKKLESLL